MFEEATSGAGKDADFLVQGTLYPDVIESFSPRGGPSVTIKTHHNVGGLKPDMKFKLIEPLRELFKDEVRNVGRELGLARGDGRTAPVPGPGLGIRVLGAVNEPALDVLRRADAIYLEEIREANLYDEIWQAFAVLLPVRSVGVMGDYRTYENVVALRAVTSTDGMTADWYPFPHDVLGAHLQSHHQRGARRESRRVRRELQAAGDDRVGVALRGVHEAELREGRRCRPLHPAMSRSPSSQWPPCRRCRGDWHRRVSIVVRARWTILLGVRPARRSAASDAPRARRRRVRGVLRMGRQARGDVRALIRSPRQADARVSRGTARALHLAASALPDVAASSTSLLARRRALPASGRRASAQPSATGIEIDSQAVRPGSRQSIGADRAQIDRRRRDLRDLAAPLFCTGRPYGVADQRGLQDDLFDSMPKALFVLLPVFAGILTLFYPQAAITPSICTSPLHAARVRFLALSCRAGAAVPTHWLALERSSEFAMLLWLPIYRHSRFAACTAARSARRC